MKKAVAIATLQSLVSEHSSNIYQEAIDCIKNELTKTVQVLPNIDKEQEEEKTLKCPYCKNEHPIPEVAYYNAEAYGSNSFQVCCIECGGALKIYLSRNVKCCQIDATDFTQSSWGEKPKLTSKTLYTSK